MYKFIGKVYNRKMCLDKRAYLCVCSLIEDRISWVWNIKSAVVIWYKPAEEKPHPLGKLKIILPAYCPYDLCVNGQWYTLVTWKYENHSEAEIGL